MAFAQRYSITYRCQLLEKVVTVEGDLAHLDSRLLERKLTMREGGARCRILSIEAKGEVLGLELPGDQLLFR